MYRLDVAQGIVVCGTERIVLVPKAFELLRVLAERAGKVVGKAELMAAVWPDVTVEEGNLDKLVFMLRKELGEDAIETVPRRGYRLTLAMHTADTPRAVNPAAYDLYVQGRYLWNRRPGEVVQRSLDSFQRAIEVDPGFAAAYAGIADVYSTLGSWEAGALPHGEAQAKAWSYASRALELDPDLIDAHTTRAYATLHYAWDVPGALDRFEHALAIDADYAAAHHWYSQALVAAGRFDDSLAASRAALARDPMNVLLHVHVAWHWLLAGDPAASLDQAARVVSMDPHFHWGHWFTGWGAEATGDIARAVDAMRTAHECSGGDAVMLAGLGRMLATAGDRAAALAIVDTLTARGLFAYEIALIHVALGDRASALASLEQARAARSGWIVYARVDPRLATLRDDASFPAAAPMAL
jgi:tetratricopeptide (TPR) repeat protein